MGQNFTIEVNISGVVDLYGWEIKLGWNSTLLEATNAIEGDFLKEGGETFFATKINNTAGYLLVDCTLLGNLSGVSGNGILVTVQFYVEGSKECILNLYDTTLVSSAEQPIPHTIAEDQVTLDVAPPVEIPGLPPGADISDHSDQDPQNFQLTVTLETTAYMFQNFTLLANSTRKVDLSLTVDSQVGLRYFLLTLQPDQSLALDINITLVPSSEVPGHNHSIGLYLDIEPNSTQVEVSSTLGLYINETRLESERGREIDISELSWAYWNGTGWTEIESHINQDGYLITETTHLSHWTVIPEFPARWMLMVALFLLSAITLALRKRMYMC